MHLWEPKVSHCGIKEKESKASSRVVWPGASPDLYSLLLSPRVFRLFINLNLCLPACLVWPCVPNKGLLLHIINEREGTAWGGDEGCFSEIFNRVLEGMRLYWPQLTQTTNSVIEPYLCATLNVYGWLLFHRAAFALFTIFSKWES